MKPADYRAGGRNAAIRFAVGECSLGSILVARSGRGVCAILLGDDPAALVRDLEDRFPHAELSGGDAGFEDLVSRSSASSRRRRWVSTCRSTSAARLSRNASGGAVRDPGGARPRPTPKSPGASVRRNQCAPSRRPGRQQDRGRDSCRSRRAQRRRPFRLPLGRGTQARAAGSRGRWRKPGSRNLEFLRSVPEPRRHRLHAEARARPQRGSWPAVPVGACWCSRAP